MKHITSLSYPYLDRQNHIIHVNSGLSLVPYVQVPYQLELFNQLIDSLKKNAADLGEFLPWAKNFSEEGFENHYQERLRDFDEASKSANRSYFIKLHDEIIGALDLHDIYLPTDKRKGGGEIGFYLFKEHRKKGLLRQALTALIEIYFTEYNFERFVFIIDAANARSINVALKIGAKFEGLLRRHLGKQMYQYSYILPDDYLDNIVQPDLYENPATKVEDFQLIPAKTSHSTEILPASDVAADNQDFALALGAEASNLVWEETSVEPESKIPGELGNAQFIEQSADLSRMLSDIHRDRLQIQKDINDYLSKIQDLIHTETKLKLDETFLKHILRSAKEQEELQKALDFYDEYDTQAETNLKLLDFNLKDKTEATAVVSPAILVQTVITDRQAEQTTAEPETLVATADLTATAASQDTPELAEKANQTTVAEQGEASATAPDSTVIVNPEEGQAVESQLFRNSTALTSEPAETPTEQSKP